MAKTYTLATNGSAIDTVLALYTRAGNVASAVKVIGTMGRGFCGLHSPPFLLSLLL